MRSYEADGEKEMQKRMRKHNAMVMRIRILVIQFCIEDWTFKQIISIFNLRFMNVKMSR